jgi:hypothetical protein
MITIWGDSYFGNCDAIKLSDERASLVTAVSRVMMTTFTQTGSLPAAMGLLQRRIGTLSGIQLVLGQQSPYFSNPL